MDLYSRLFKSEFDNINRFFFNQNKMNKMKDLKMLGIYGPSQHSTLMLLSLNLIEDLFLKNQGEKLINYSFQN